MVSQILLWLYTHQDIFILWTNEFKMVRPDTSAPQLTFLVLTECEHIKFLERHCSTLQYNITLKLQYQHERAAVRYKLISATSQLSNEWAFHQHAMHIIVVKPY